LEHKAQEQGETTFEIKAGAQNTREDENIGT